MGNVADKCSCFNSKKEGNQENMVLEYKHVTSKGTKTAINKLEAEFMNNKIDKTKTIEKESKYKSELNKDMIINLSRLQAFIRGFNYRLKFPKIKKRLIDLKKRIIEKYVNEFKTPVLYRAENNFKVFDIDGWTKYYSHDSSYLFNYDRNFFGMLLKTSICIYNEISYYIGTVNIRNQRCGFGRMVNIEGAKFEGNWVNNKFTGWGRYIDPEGTIWEGKLF